MNSSPAQHRWFAREPMYDGNTRGLTLIELAVILTVVFILIALTIPPLRNARLRAEVARVHQDLQAIESAVEWYYNEHERYPEAAQTNQLADGEGDGMDNGLMRLVEPVPYLDIAPQDRFQTGSLFGKEYQLYQFGSGGNQRVNGHYSGAWMVVSVGPNGRIESRRIDTFPEATVAEEYSPTNGLRSDGDILRYGGNWNSGDWFLNGKRINSNR